MSVQMRQVGTEKPFQETIISFATRAPVAKVARALFALRQGAPMIAILQSPQAKMDLVIEEVITETGLLSGRTAEAVGTR